MQQRERKKYEIERRKRLRKRRRRVWKCCFTLIMVLGIGILGGKILSNLFTTKETIMQKQVLRKIADSDVIPQDIKDLLERNPETYEFVKDFERMKDEPPASSIGNVVPGEIPLLLQWDERWGYDIYGDNLIAINGCGPTVVSMVATGLTGNDTLTPAYVADLAEEQGYYEYGAGTSWLFMTEGVQQFGIYGEELSLDEASVFSALENGEPIICSVRKGDFTAEGHFIVLTGVRDGKIRVNDPNSKIKSEKLWEYDRLASQINNLWRYTVKPELFTEQYLK